eukprot:TRINITY_DN97489_c0_g1_i1.p1 TRINITY_DN97489_c0_g1~~TRINITY_DN97489_c0_g1_i1.p1  ORF type:complete len:294 (-),score=59.37 TRINITY_DN97489_c0_g1_i1:87-968(-)
MHYLLRQTLNYNEDQIRILVDGETGQLPEPSQVPTREHILAGLQWLMEGAQAGDSLLLLFCGYGTQHPKEPNSVEHESYIVPSDFAADVPPHILKASPAAAVAAATAAPSPSGNAAYRLISFVELNHFIAQIPAGASLTTILDCSYPAVPGISPAYQMPATFPRVARGRVDYRKLHDFVSRPRFLELPVLPVRHTPKFQWSLTFPACKVYVFCACKHQEWDAELPLEGTVQGTFTWALLKAITAGAFKRSVRQLHQEIQTITAGLKEHFQGVEQTPALMISTSASLDDTALQL